MTPEKIKADELFNEYYSLIPARMGRYDLAKDCALIAVNEIQNTKSVYVNHTEYDYWEQVKTEIEKL